MTDEQKETLTAVALFAGLALIVVGAVVWFTAPKPPSCNAQSEDVAAAEEYLNDIPRSPLGSIDVNAGLRQQGEARLKAAESAQASCRLARSATVTSGREDMGVKTGLAGLVIAGAAAFTLWRDQDEDTDTVRVDSERVAPPSPPPPAPQQVNRADAVYSQLRDLNPEELQRLADLADANRAAEPEDYPAYAEDTDTDPERTRSGWGTASKRRLTFGDEGNES